jgi:hypothetical protein
MQNAYASYQFTQLTGRLSCEPGELVQVEVPARQLRFVSVGDILTTYEATQPCSLVPGVALFASPRPPFNCVWMPEPAGGVQPVPPSGGKTAFTNWRKRPTVTSYLSSRKLFTVAGSASPVGPLPEFE